MIKSVLALLLFTLPMHANAADASPAQLRAKAAAGDVGAATKMGDYYQNKKDLKTAEKWYHAAANAGDAQAQYKLATVYDETGKSSDNIIPWLEKSANNGVVDAQLMLGKIYQFGRRGVDKDVAKSRKFYNMAAARGSKEALNQLELIYQQNGSDYMTSVQADENVEWINMQVEQGNAEAALQLGSLAQEGRGVPQDYKRAAKLYETAANAGLAQAQTRLGSLYASGLGVEQNYTTAVDWLEKAADQGYVDAQRKLASIYAYNLAQPEKAYAWLVLSLSAMFPHEQDLVKISPDLEKLMATMTVKQLDDGQKLAMQYAEIIKKSKQAADAQQKKQMQQMKKYQKNTL